MFISCTSVSRERWAGFAATVFLCSVSSEITARSSPGGFSAWHNQRKVQGWAPALAWLPFRAGLCQGTRAVVPSAAPSAPKFSCCRAEEAAARTAGAEGAQRPPLLVSCLISWRGKDGLDRTRKQEGEGRLIYPVALLFLLPCDLEKQGDDVSFEVQSTPHPSPRSGLPPPPSLGPAAFLQNAADGWRAGAVLTGGCGRGLRSCISRPDLLCSNNSGMLGTDREGCCGVAE